MIRRRSFALDAAALMLLDAIAVIALIGHVRAEPLTTRTFKDSVGREIGRSTTSGNTTTFRDSMGRETGRAVRSGNGTTFYDNFGRETRSRQSQSVTTASRCARAADIRACTHKRADVGFGFDPDKTLQFVRNSRN
jgi:hypothetical protein